MPKCELSSQPLSGNPKLKLGDLLVVTDVPVGSIYGFKVGELYLVSVIASERGQSNRCLKIADLRTGEIFDPDAIKGNAIKVRVLSPSESLVLTPS